jgi:uncharacterized membrane protein
MSAKEPKPGDIKKESLVVEKIFDSIEVIADTRRVLYVTTTNAERVAESYYLLRLVVILAFVSAIEWSISPALPYTQTRLLTSIKLLILVVLLATWISHEIFKYAEKKALRQRVETIRRVREERKELFDDLKATLSLLNITGGQGDKKNG